MLIVPDQHIAVVIVYKKLDWQMIILKCGKFLNIHLRTAIASPAEFDDLYPFLEEKEYD